MRTSLSLPLFVSEVKKLELICIVCHCHAALVGGRGGKVFVAPVVVVVVCDEILTRSEKGGEGGRSIHHNIGGMEGEERWRGGRRDKVAR